MIKINESDFAYSRGFEFDGLIIVGETSWNGRFKDIAHLELRSHNKPVWELFVGNEYKGKLIGTPESNYEESLILLAVHLTKDENIRSKLKDINNIYLYDYTTEEIASMLKEVDSLKDLELRVVDFENSKSSSEFIENSKKYKLKISIYRKVEAS